MYNEQQAELRVTQLMLVLFITLQGVEGVTSSLDVTPDDTAVLAGASATLQCSVNRADTTINWIRDPLGSPVPVVAGCVVQAGHENDYNVSADAANGDCNLIIKSTATAAASVADQYNCLDTTTGFSAAADVVVLAGAPIGFDNLTEEAVCPESNVGLSCSVKFYSRDSSAVKPTFTWLPNTIGEITNTGNSTHAISSAVTTVPLEPASANATCIVEYPAGTKTPYSWSSVAFSGTYYPQNVAISPNSTQYTEGDILTCSAKTCEGIVTFTWETTLDVTESDGQTLTLVVGEYSVTCIASFQPISRRRKRSLSSTYSSNATIHVVVYPNSTGTTATATKVDMTGTASTAQTTMRENYGSSGSNGYKTATILLGVLFGISLAALIAVVVLFALKKIVWANAKKAVYQSQEHAQQTVAYETVSPYQALDQRTQHTPKPTVYEQLAITDTAGETGGRHPQAACYNVAQ